MEDVGGITETPQTGDGVQPLDTAAMSDYVPAPLTWAKEVSDTHWRNLPRDLRDYISTRERESHNRISELGTRTKSLEQYQPVADLFERHRPYVPELQHLRAEQAVELLLVAHNHLKTNPQAAIQYF